MKLFFLFASFSPLLLSCAVSPGPYQPGTLYHVSSRLLSLNVSDLKTCVFDPQYSIVHFPMYHMPPDGHYSAQDFEKVSQSQFQLMHTIIDYNRSASWDLAVFDEHIIEDHYNESYLQDISSGLISSPTYEKADGQILNLKERLTTARHLFQSGFPQYYEQLSHLQKDFLFQMGASLSLYLLQEIPKIHKVIPPQQYDLVKANLKDPFTGLLNLEGKDYWVYTFREQALQQEVLNFWRTNTGKRKLILIAYGARHNFQPFFSGYPFQSGHGFCLNWLKNLGQSPPLLP